MTFCDAIGLWTAAFGFVLCFSSTDPATRFMEEMDRRPPSERLPHWEKTKERMSRRAPAVGETAPDFTLKSLDGQQSITRSTFHKDRPLVLVFGSFT